jgi:hypothetical protein
MVSSRISTRKKERKKETFLNSAEYTVTRERGMPKNLA